MTLLCYQIKSCDFTSCCYQGRNEWAPLLTSSPDLLVPLVVFKIYCKDDNIKLKTFKNNYATLSSSRMQHKVKFDAEFNRFDPDFSFSLMSCHSKVKELSLLNYLPIPGRRIVGFIPFWGYQCCVKCKQSLSGFELWSLCPFLVIITLTLQVPPNIKLKLFKRKYFTWIMEMSCRWIMY